MRSAAGPKRLVRAAAASLGAAALLLSVGASASASGGASDPPGWSGATPGEWVAFAVSPTTANPIGRSGKYEPVTITRDAHLGTTSLATAFNGWPMRDTDNDPLHIPDELGWPEVWSDGKVTLTRVDWCVATEDHCSYQVTDPGPFHFAAGDPPPIVSDGLPNYAIFPPVQSVQRSVPPELNIVFSWNPSTAATPANGTTRVRLTLDASGSTDQFPGKLVFEWTVTRASDSKPFTAAPDPVARFDLDADDVYCVSLKVTNTADTFSKSYGVGGTDCQRVDGVAPRAPAGSGDGGSGVGGIPTSDNAGAPAGSGDGGSGVGGIPTSDNAGAPTVVFAPPLRTSSALTGGGQNVDSSVIWLWRPDWYQPTSQTQQLPETGGAPELKGRTDIVVSTANAPNSDAGPWLAGLGAFGLIGVGWVLNKRRQVRSEY